MSPLKHLPNLISVVRIVLVFPFLFFLYTQEHALAFYTFLIAGISDGIDGKVARTFDCKTKLGSYLDPLSDKIFITSAMVALAHLNLAPWPLVCLVIARDLIIIACVLIWKYGFNETKDLTPTLIGKFNTVVQIMFIIIILCASAFAPLTNTLYHVMLALLVTTLVVSFLQYAIIFINRMFEK